LGKEMGKDSSLRLGPVSGALASEIRPST